MQNNIYNVYSTVKVKVKVIVTLRLTASQSVMSCCRDQSRTFEQRFFFQIYCLVFFGAPSLTRGRVCHLSVFVTAVYNSQ
jgi:hypothetical protein